MSAGELLDVAPRLDEVDLLIRAAVEADRDGLGMTDFHAKYFAHELTGRIVAASMKMPCRPARRCSEACSP